MWWNNWFFDKKDYEILSLMSDIADNDRTDGTEKAMLDAGLHPHGIKGLICAQEFRIAYAVVNLLRSLEAGQASARLTALQALYDEVLASAHSVLRRNTARVLIKVIKELTVERDPNARLRLAHDFRSAARGTPRVVRRLLERYHLLEMPEDWSQLAFDDHVHDANTKGRKTPTHLIMDAWVKGLRRLTVVYHNFVNTAAAEEVLAAAEIMGITVRIGLEYRMPFRDRYVSLVWTPRGFTDSASFLEFLQRDAVAAHMAWGRERSHATAKKVLEQLEAWNENMRTHLSEAWGIAVPPLSCETLQAFVGVGQLSRTHLAECLLQHVMPAMRQRAAYLARSNATEEERAELSRLESFGYEELMRNWLAPLLAEEPRPDSLTAKGLVERLGALHPGYRMVLSLADLSAEDVLELLWDCRGGITHLEIYNIRDWQEGRLTHLHAVSELRHALNVGRSPRLKQIVRQMIYHMEQTPDQGERCKKFQNILHDLPVLWKIYRRSPLKSRVGSSSTSRSLYNFRMGLVFPATLPSRARKAVRRRTVLTTSVPIHTTIEERDVRVHTATQSSGLLTYMLGMLHCVRWRLGRVRQWVAFTDTARMSFSGNMVSLSGPVIPHRNRLLPPQVPSPQRPPLRYLNSGCANALKVLAGFLPAALSFWYTQAWWFLALFGPFIWFAITGVRNVIQMVLAGNGMTRGSLLRWKDHVSVDRLCDSLMYTGISVLLLEAGVRVLLLEKGLGISVASEPGLVFTVLNVINGFYICAHTVYRGFPRAASIGNLFRSVLAIPISSLFNITLLYGLAMMGVHDPLYYVVPGAAIVSKLGSDTVAAIIEGYADARNNLRMRRWDYEGKLAAIFACYERLELMFPEQNVLTQLARPGGVGCGAVPEAQPLERKLMIHVLDLMYFWFYQPRAPRAFKDLLDNMSKADKTVLLRLQLVLLRQREISQLAVNGLLVGTSFSGPLAFYLACCRDYLHAVMPLLGGRRGNHRKVLPVDSATSWSEQAGAKHTVPAE